MVVAAGAINAQGGAAAANEARRRAKVAAAVERESNRSVDVTSPRAPKPRGLFRQATAKAFGNDVLPYQRQVREFYTSNIIQQIIAVIIMLNFFGNMVEKELDPPYGKRYAEQWLIIEDIFNYIFLLELVLNLWGSWFVPFWKSGWNVFDFFVVTVGVLSLLRMIDGPLSLLRMLRAFRVFRLFKRIKSLNKIIVSLARAVPGVAQAFVIMMIFMAIYAILAVEFFAEFGIPYAKNLSAANEKELVEMIQAATKGEGADGGWVETPEYYYVTQYTPYWGMDASHNTTNLVPALTARGLPYGYEYFGSFTKAYYTMWQILTGESWSEAVVRPIVFGWRDGGIISPLLIALFFTSFIIICAIVLINVVVAVLLEKMVEPAAEDDDDDSEQDKARNEPPLPSAAAMRSTSTAIAPAPEYELGPASAGSKPLNAQLDAISMRMATMENKVDRLIGLERKLDSVLEALANQNRGLAASPSLPELPSHDGS